jgi:hypothetical protein
MTPWGGRRPTHRIMNIISCNPLQTAAGPMELPISKRAKTMADGLIRTGRASDYGGTNTHIQLRAKRGGFYWITADGDSLMHGDTLDGAEELQPNFAQAMVQAGRRG